MKEETENETILIRYLLGDLSEEEQTQIEQKYFLVEDYHNELRALERDLIDRYVRGELSNHECLRFETHFMLSPGRKEKVEFARALAKTISISPARELRQTRIIIPRWRPLFGRLHANNRAAIAVAAILVASICGLWVISSLQRETDRGEPEQVVRQQNRSEPAKNQSAGQSARPESERALPPSADPPAPQQPGSEHVTGVATFVLRPDLFRDEGSVKKIFIAKGKKIIRLRLQFDEDDYKTYQAVLQTPEGEQIVGGGKFRVKLRRYGEAVVELSARLLDSRDYVLILRGLNAEGESEDAGKYYFVVVRG